MTPIITGDHTSSPAFSLTFADLQLRFDIENNMLRQHCLAPASLAEATRPEKWHQLNHRETALHCTDGNRLSQKIIGGDPGHHLQWGGTAEPVGESERQVTLVQRDPQRGLDVYSEYRFYEPAPVVPRFTRLVNSGDSPVGIEYCSSAMLYGFMIDSPQSIEQDLVIHWASNHWMCEAQWRHSSPDQLGWYYNGRTMAGGIQMTNRRSMSSGGLLPMAMIENRRMGLTWFWQIEHSGPWHWELGLAADQVYLYLGGPDEWNHHAWKNIEPGETYQTVPVAVGCVRGGFTEAVAALTAYRRQACLPRSFRTLPLPVIFNDYMNCLKADPTTDKLIPVIDAAAEVGCDCFVIDAGWYADLNAQWWDTIGWWQPSTSRFPNGLDEVMARIHDHHMKPGLWFEIELAGINSLLKDKPDDWFFMHRGRRFIDGSRYFLDFRNPEVRAFASQVFDDLINRFKLGYIKRDYNCSCRFGTDHRADSPGQGLFEHTHSLAGWLDDLRDRHPHLILENCSGGGMRIDYQMLSRHDIHSSSDQEDYRRYPAILTGQLAAVLPEQMAVWSYPLADADLDQTTFNMVSALLCRIHLSGRIHEINLACREAVRQAVSLYKTTIRRYIPEATPFFPLGLPAINDTVSPIALGLEHPETIFIAIWRLDGKPTVTIVSPAGKPARLLYPLDLGIKVENQGRKVQITFPRPFMAALLQI